MNLHYFNSRKGSFSIDDPELGVPGNAAMKDQTLAIKWVHDNIEYFRGDSNNIMVFGDSAAGASVHLQVLSPMTKGMTKIIFKRIFRSYFFFSF